MKFPFPSGQLHKLWPTGQFSNTTGLTDTQACLNCQSPRWLHTVQRITSPPHFYIWRQSNLEAQHDAVPLIQDVYTTLESVTKNCKIFKKGKLWKTAYTHTGHMNEIQYMCSVNIHNLFIINALEYFPHL